MRPLSGNRLINAANPYSSPVDTLPSKAVAQDDPVSQELTAFFGPRANYFIQQWRAVESGGKRARFNWAAFVFSAVWLSYRKMYRLAAICYALVIVTVLLEDWLFLVFLDYPKFPDTVSRVTNLAFGLVCGLFGNRWYLAHARREIAWAKAAGFEGDLLRVMLARRGRTSFLGGSPCWAFSSSS
nr:MAG: hypothetical protein DIU80_23750 [Chloroflexota bacterium]